MAIESHDHVHINTYRGTLPPSVCVLIERHGLLCRAYQIRNSDGSFSPLWIVTKKVPSREIAVALFKDITTTLAEDPHMNGYVEREVIKKGSVMRLDGAPYRVSEPLPLARPDFIQAKRGADIHISRSIETSGDALDGQLTELGFYEVISEKERIWTLLIEDPIDAQRLFAKLKHHFGHAGGITKIEMEEVEELIPVPKDFQLMPVAKAGSFNDARSHE